jgi:AcrR family transcriptional regulator
MLRSGLAIVISPDRIAEGKRLYELTSTPVHDIAAMMGVSRPTLQRRIKKWGWVPRKPAGHVTVREEVASPPDGIAPTGDIFAMPPTTREERLALAAYFHRTVERGLDAVHRILGKNGPGDEAGTERAARALAITFRALREMTAVMPNEKTTSDDETSDEPVPRSIDEFRDALADQIEKILQAHRDRSGASAGGTACGDNGGNQAE